MDSNLCLFCDSEYGDPMQPYHVDKVAALCHLTSNKHQISDKKICMRCKLDIDLIENAMRLRDIMVGTLNVKLAKDAVRSLSDSTNSSSRASDTMPPAPPRDNTVRPDVLPTDQEVHITPNSMSHINGNQQRNIKMEPNPQTQRQPESHHQMNGNYSYPMPSSNGVYHSAGAPTRSRRIQSCHKCNISLKTRPYPDAMKHINRCNGQGIRPGRPSLTPRPDMFPCHLCGRKLATKEAHDVHVARCDGVNNNTRGRKPADNTCMLCDEDLVYRHILKKHLRQKHGINAQRLDDSVLAALKTGTGTGCDVKEQVLSKIQQKMLTDMCESYDHGEGQKVNDLHIAQKLQEEEESSLLGDDSTEENTTPPCDRSADHSHSTRSRRKVKPSKYVPEIYTCELCTKQFEYQSQYNQHCCFKIKDVESNAAALTNGDRNSEPDNAELVARPASASMVQSYTAMEVEDSSISE